VKRKRANLLEQSKRASALKDGMSVEVTKDDGSIVRTKTRSDPWFMGGHTWMVLLEGFSGAYACARVKPAPEARP
jgi:hypothetical protein